MPLEKTIEKEKKIKTLAISIFFLKPGSQEKKMEKIHSQDMQLVTGTFLITSSKLRHSSGLSSCLTKSHNYKCVPLLTHGDRQHYKALDLGAHCMKPHPEETVSPFQTLSNLVHNLQNRCFVKTQLKK